MANIHATDGVHQMPRRTRTSLEHAPTSSFVNGHFPRRRGLIVLVSALLGFALTVVWSYEFVDHVIGDNVANSLLGHDAKTTPIAGAAAGVVFALVSGLAGTFTACNIAAFGAMAPCLGEVENNRRTRLTHILKALAWLSFGMLAVSIIYGAIVGLVGTSMPQFSTTQIVLGTMPPFLVQSMVVFGVIGLAMCYMGLAVIGVVPDPLGRVAKRFPQVHMVFVGVLVGGFLIGRPFPLFRQLFREAAESGNPFYGAAAFSLQSVGNIVIMAVLILVMGLVLPDGLQRWFRTKPSRLTVITAMSLLIFGVFTFLYWDVRLLASLKVIPWYPLAPWL